MKKKLLYIGAALMLSMSMVFAGCAKSQSSTQKDSSTTTPQDFKEKGGTLSTDQPQQQQTQPQQPQQLQPDPSKTQMQPPTDLGLKGKKPVVTIEMQDGAKIKIELYPDIAPVTVNNFVYLVQKGFYNNLGFHRVIPGFMIQGGDPLGTGTGDPGYTIKGEFSENSIKNDLKHERGVISMARSNDPNSAGSQFFIMVDAAPFLDGKYAAFGKVIEGMDAVDKIVNTVTVVSPYSGQKEQPKVPQVMKKVTVEIK